LVANSCWLAAKAALLKNKLVVRRAAEQSEVRVLGFIRISVMMYRG
jgi:hypothetical protein